MSEMLDTLANSILIAVKAGGWLLMAAGYVVLWIYVWPLAAVLTIIFAAMWADNRINGSRKRR